MYYRITLASFVSGNRERETGASYAHDGWVHHVLWVCVSGRHAISCWGRAKACRTGKEWQCIEKEA